MNKAENHAMSAIIASGISVKTTVSHEIRRGRVNLFVRYIHIVANLSRGKNGTITDTFRDNKRNLDSK